MCRGYVIIQLVSTMNSRFDAEHGRRRRRRALSPYLSTFFFGGGVYPFLSNSLLKTYRYKLTVRYTSLSGAGYTGRHQCGALVSIHMPGTGTWYTAVVRVNPIHPVYFFVYYSIRIVIRLRTTRDSASTRRSYYYQSSVEAVNGAKKTAQYGEHKQSPSAQHGSSSFQYCVRTHCRVAVS